MVTHERPKDQLTRTWPSTIIGIHTWAVAVGLAAVATNLRLIRKWERRNAKRRGRPYTVRIEPFTDEWTSTAVDAAFKASQAAIQRWTQSLTTSR